MNCNSLGDYNKEIMHILNNSRMLYIKNTIQCLLAPSISVELEMTRPGKCMIVHWSFYMLIFCKGNIIFDSTPKSNKPYDNLY